MNVELARTFLAVFDTGSFVHAAERIYVTQSTVSMRIKSLEQQLGKVLFERKKAGAVPTPAGNQFRKHAAAMVRVWEQARLEISLPQGFHGAFTIGGHYSLWEGFLMDWLSRMRKRTPGIAIRTQMAFSDALMHRLIDGTLDLGVMYTPQSRPGFEVEMLFKDELMLVSSEQRPPRRPGKNYIFIDWGPEFQADHGRYFPGLSIPGLYMELRSLGLSYLLANPASGYFPRRLVEPHLKDGRLREVPDAPAFEYPAYVVYPTDGDPAVLQPALRTLRWTAARQTAVLSPPPPTPSPT